MNNTLKNLKGFLIGGILATVAILYFSTTVQKSDFGGGFFSGLLVCFILMGLAIFLPGLLVYIVKQGQNSEEII